MPKSKEIKKAEEQTQNLTAKQEAFAQSIAMQDPKDPISQASAYRMHYNAEGMTDNSVYCEASKLMSNPKIAHRIKDLRAPYEEKLHSQALITADEIILGLKRIQMKAEAAEKFSDANKSYELLGKTLAMFVDKKIIEHKVDELEEFKAAQEFLLARGFDVKVPKTIQ